MKLKAKILDEQAIRRALARISYEIVEYCNAVENLLLVGIRTRGIPLARVIAENISNIVGIQVSMVELDPTAYRDDVENFDAKKNVLERGITLGKDVILVDDVLFTGRTVRAAIEAVLDCGRAKSIRLAVLVDRGHRELPIKADFVGKNVPTSRREEVVVRVGSVDGDFGVYIYEKD